MRVGFQYEDKSLQPSEPSNYAFFDPVINNLVAAGVNVLLLLDGLSMVGNPSMTAPISEWEPYVANYSVRANTLATHYGSKVAAFEIWNEPDGNGMPATTYALMLKGAYTAIKSAGSLATVVSAGLDDGDPGYVTTFINANGGKLYADAVGIHPYGRRPFPNWPSTTWGFGPLLPFLQTYLAVTLGAPLWITEVGTNDLTVQNDFPMEAFEAVNENVANLVPKVFWFCWSDGMVSPFGVMYTNNTAKPSYYSFATFAGLPPS